MLQSWRKTDLDKTVQSVRISKVLLTNQATRRQHFHQNIGSCWPNIQQANVIITHNQGFLALKCPSTFFGTFAGTMGSSQSGPYSESSFLINALK